MGTVFAVVGTILLWLLKLILIVLLAVLLLVLLVLFCPVRYRGYLEKEGTFSEGTFSVEGRLSWLLGLVRFTIAYEDGKQRGCLRLLGIDIAKLLERRGKRRRKKRDKKASRKGKRKAESFPDEEEEDWEEEDDGEELPEDDEEETWEPEEQTENFSVPVPPEQEDGEQDGLFVHWKQKFAERIQWVKDTYQAFRKLLSNIRHKREWLAEVKEFWYLENTQSMVCIFKDNVLHLWRKLKPKVVRGTIVFGAGDPCLTGQILGGVALLYAAYGRGVAVEPDFEMARLEGNLLIKGRISAITALAVVLRVFWRKEWKQFKGKAEQLKEAL